MLGDQKPIGNDMEHPPQGWLSPSRSKERPFLIDDLQKFEMKVKIPCYIHALRGEKLQRAGRLLIKSAQIDQGIVLLNRALDITRLIEGVVSRQVASIMNEISAAYLQKNDIEHAELYGKAALGSFPLVYHADIAPIYITLIDIAFSKKQIETAIEYSKAAIKSINYHFGRSHPLHIDIHIALAAGYIKMKDGLRSIQQLNQASNKSRNILGESHPYTIKVDILTAKEYRRQQLWADSITTFKRALSIAQALFSQISCEVSEIEYEIAETYKMNDSFTSAMEYAQRSLQTRRELLGDCDLNTLNSMSQVAYLLKKCGEFLKAVEIYEVQLKSLRILAEPMPLTLERLVELDQEGNDYNENTGTLENIQSSPTRDPFRRIDPNQEYHPPNELLEQIQAVTRECILILLNPEAQELKKIIQIIRTTDDQTSSISLIQRVINNLDEKMPSEYIDQLFMNIFNGSDDAFAELRCVFQLSQGEELRVPEG
ncbi:MAG: hypothetical protein EZS28_011351 [Streblomastix strix]|uniref:Uncharacterized protein n=1 Tax=Streblomastix strix TaxID=222440 RepID=A0A5J4WEK7_9EUKA|nr:MAG: hypothetical protein EZS28_011351 [Streblomastix strix]